VTGCMFLHTVTFGEEGTNKENKGSVFERYRECILVLAPVECVDS
jgi:hypothetical protein